MPGLGGGANWQSGAADPETGFVYVGSSTSPGVIGMNQNNDPDRDGVDSDYTIGGGLPSVQGLRIVKPPYGRITAYNMNKGEIAWQIPNGDTPADVKNNPALQGITHPEDRQPLAGRPAGDEDAALRRRGRGRPAGPPRLRQGDRRRDLADADARTADQPADDLPAQRPAVHRHRRARQRRHAAAIRDSGRS